MCLSSQVGEGLKDVLNLSTGKLLVALAQTISVEIIGP